MISFMIVAEDDEAQDADDAEVMQKYLVPNVPACTSGVEQGKTLATCCF